MIGQSNLQKVIFFL